MAKILLIDDEPDVIEFQKKYLERRKHIVSTAANTQEAMDSIKRESPDVIFCDVRLETDTAGLEILAQAKKIIPNTIVYLVTGLTDKEIEEKGFALGAKEILIKPLTNEALAQKIQG